MTDLHQLDPVGSQFVERTCAALEVDAASVDIVAIHALTREVAHTIGRPLAPVSAYILGVAVGRAAAQGQVMGESERAELIARIPLD